VIVLKVYLEALPSSFYPSDQSSIKVLYIDEFVVIYECFLDSIFIQINLECYKGNSAFIEILDCVIFKYKPCVDWGRAFEGKVLNAQRVISIDPLCVDKFCIGDCHVHRILLIK
jgi:hypothetical protein